MREEKGRASARGAVTAGLFAGVVAGVMVAMRELAQVAGRDVVVAPLLAIRHIALLVLVLVAGGVVIGLLARAVMAIVWRIGARSSSDHTVGRRARLGIVATMAAVIIIGAWSGLPSMAIWADVAVIALLLIVAYPDLARPGGTGPDELMPGFTGGIVATLLFFGLEGLFTDGSALPRAVVMPALAGVIAAAVGYGLYRILRRVFLRSGGTGGGRIFGVTAAALCAVLVALVWWQSIDDRNHLARRIQESGISRRPDTDANGPNVIVISVDTLRADYVGYAGGPVRTPTIDAMAEESFVFTRAYSAAPWTRPAFAALLSGLYPSEMGVARIAGYERSDDMIIPYHWAVEPEMLPEVFQKSGWNTAATVCNANLFSFAHADQGFMLFHHTSERQNDRATRLADDLTGGRVLSDSLERADTITDAAIQTLSAAERPLFFWAHYLDPHNPYIPPTLPEKQHSSASKIGGAAAMEMRSAASREKALRAYVGEIEYTDSQLARVMNLLRSSGLWDSSIVVFLSDHGEEFWEHGSWQHGQSLFEDQMRVPLLIHMPGQSQGVTVDDPVSLLDVMPTLLDLCDLDAPEVRGVSLAPVLTGEADGVEPHPFFMEACYRGGIRKAMLVGDYKLIYDLYFDDYTLYNISENPDELRNLYGDEGAPDEVTRWQSELAAWSEQSLAVMKGRVGGTAIELSPEIREQLRDMGYIQ